jgi:hypothetical protein
VTLSKGLDLKEVDIDHSLKATAPTCSTAQCSQNCRSGPGRQRHVIAHEIVLDAHPLTAVLVPDVLLRRRGAPSEDREAMPTKVGSLRDARARVP